MSQARSQRMGEILCACYVVPSGRSIPASMTMFLAQVETVIGLDEVFMSFLIHGYRRWSQEDAYIMHQLRCCLSYWRVEDMMWI
jgi:hypothetical protein